MKIRILKHEDANIYRELRLEGLKADPEAFSSSYEEEKAHSLKRFEERLNGAHVFTFGAFVENELIGIVTLLLEARMKTMHKAYIVGMYVTSEKRRSGIGRALMIEAIKLARTKGEIEQIYLSVTSSNQPARKLYQSLGFNTYGIASNALKINNTYLDDELMVLFL